MNKTLSKAGATISCVREGSSEKHESTGVPERPGI